MPIAAAAVAGFAANEARGILKQGWDVAVYGEADYIKDGEAVGVIPSLGLSAARLACRVYGNNPGGVTSEQRALRMERACRPYLDSIGAGSPIDIKTPFRGGQCPGVGYRVRGSASYTTPLCAGNDPIPGSLNLADFVSGAVILQGPITSARVERYSAGGNCGNNGLRVVVVHANGTYTQNLTTTTTTRFFNDLVSSVSMERVSGTDDCGQPPPVVVDPGPDPTPSPPTIRFQPTANVDVDITVEVLPDATINVDFGTGDISIDPFADDPAGSGGGGAAPGDQGTAGTPESTGPSGELGGEAPEGSVLTGLKLDLIAAPRGAKEYAPGVYRGAAYVYMGGIAGLDQDFAGAMLADGQFIFAEKDNLTKWRVAANSGYNWLVTPYYREVEA